MGSSVLLSLRLTELLASFMAIKAIHTGTRVLLAFRVCRETQEAEYR